MDNVRRRYPVVVYYIWGGCAIVEKVGTLKIEYWWLVWYNEKKYLEEKD